MQVADKKHMMILHAVDKSSATTASKTKNNVVSTSFNRLKGMATVPMSTDEIMQLTREW